MGYQRDLDRFMAKVSKVENGCWLWKGSTTEGGYGRFYWKGKTIGAHRVSLYLFNGLSTDNKLDAMHSCDTPSCVNPAHLCYGTRFDNMKDASSKGRTVRVQDWRGALNPKAKLSDEQKAEVIRLASSGKTRAEIANKFGISDVRVGQILKEAGMASELSGIEVAIAARKAMTSCKRGHPLSGDNLRINTSGGRVCRTCERERQKARRAKAGS